jgi:hypothetical protein
MTNANANANATRGINLYTWNGAEYGHQSYTELDALKTAVNVANGNADEALVTEAFNRHKDCGKDLYSENEEGANWTDEICINIYKYYMFDNDDDQSNDPQDLDKHIKANLKVNGYHILGNDMVELNQGNFVSELAKLTPDEFKRCMIDISGFMLNQLLLGGTHNYNTLDDVKEALEEALVNNSNKTEEIKNDILNQFQDKIKQATSGSNNNRSNNVRSDKQRRLLGDDENSTVVSFAANMNRLKGVLGEGSEGSDGSKKRDLKSEIKNAIEYINEKNNCIEDKTLKLNFFNCNIVDDLDTTDDQISLKALTEELNQVFNSNEVKTSELTNILIILNGNPGLITNTNNNEYRNTFNVIDKIKNAIAGGNTGLFSKIQIQMDKFMSGRVKQIARLYNSFPNIKNPSGGSKKRSRPNKRVKTKKAKATRKKQNKRLKKNKTLKKKNRRA